MAYPAALILVGVAVFVGALLNSLSGFGFALITVPLMTIAVGPKEAVVLSALVGLVSNSAVALRNHSEIVRPVAARVLAGSLLGMPIGVLVLSRVADRALEVMIAVAVLVAAALLASGVKLSNPRPATDVGSGLLSGMFNTSIGISGPPVVMLLAGRGMPKAAFRATSVAVFCSAGVVAVTLFGLAGRYDRSVLEAAAVALPALPLGFLIGDRVHRRVPEDRFRSLVLTLMVFTAVVTIWNAFAG
ncbi:MAG: sulfite exporter TauE/SafE family protein [Microthrixaceae bacterium]|nr:sulfite exporter TauE/SafE family protein [Microthrixaceae bacterium]